MTNRWKRGCVLVFALLAASLAVSGHAVGEDNAPEDTGASRAADLTGAAVVPGPGDTDGSGFASIELNQGQGIVCFEITVADIAPATAAHIHKGDAGSTGPVVVILNPPATGDSSGCTAADANLIKDIRQTPDRYYVDVHNNDFPGGALRGQLRRGNPKHHPTPKPTPYGDGAPLSLPPGLPLRLLLTGGIGALLVTRRARGYP